MRIVAAPAGDGSFIAELDLRRRLPGRGCWLHPSPDCLDLALRRRAFVRALRLAGPLDTTRLGAAVSWYAGAGQQDRQASTTGNTSTTSTASTTSRSTPGRSTTLRRRSEPEAGYSADEHPMSTQQ